MRDGSERCDPDGATSSGRIETPFDLIGALEAFSCDVRTELDRRRCMELATAVEAWIIELRAEVAKNEFVVTPIDDETCFSRLQRDRDREKLRQDTATAEEFAATFRSLSIGYASLDSGVLHRIVSRFASIIRDRHK